MRSFFLKKIIIDTGNASEESYLCIFDTKKPRWRIQNLGQEDPYNNDSGITMGHYGHSGKYFMF